MKLKSWVGAIQEKLQKKSSICISETKPEFQKYIPKLFKIAILKNLIDISFEKKEK